MYLCLGYYSLARPNIIFSTKHLSHLMPKYHGVICEIYQCFIKSFCAFGQFQCGDLECILEHYVCDSLLDCENCVKMKLTVQVYVSMRQGKWMRCIYVTSLAGDLHVIVPHCISSAAVAAALSFPKCETEIGTAWMVVMRSRLKDRSTILYTVWHRKRGIYNG